MDDVDLLARARESFRAGAWAEVITSYDELVEGGYALKEGDRKRILISERQLKPTPWWRRALLGDVVHRPPNQG